MVQLDLGDNHTDVIARCNIGIRPKSPQRTIALAQVRAISGTIKAETELVKAELPELKQRLEVAHHDALRSRDILRELLVVQRRLIDRHLAENRLEIKIGEGSEAQVVFAALRRAVKKPKRPKITRDKADVLRLLVAAL